MARRKKYIIIEIIGLSLILLSIGWRIFIADMSTSLTTDSEFWLLNEKLNYLWLYNNYIGRKLGDTTAGAVNGIGTQHEIWWNLDKRLDFTRKQTETFNRIAGILFLFGSVFTAIGRYGELTDKVKRT